MDNLFNSGISIEKMAAFLDGNLSASEMQEMSAIIGGDTILQQIVDVSDTVDDTILSYTDNDIVLPIELQLTDFEIPQIDAVSEIEDFRVDEFSLMQDSDIAIQDVFDVVANDFTEEFNEKTFTEIDDSLDSNTERMDDFAVNDNDIEL